MYVIYKWYRNQNKLPDYLIFIEPKWESPHLENRHIVTKLAELVGSRLVTCRAEELAHVLEKYSIDTLLAADVYVEEHVMWLEKICTRTGTELVELLWNRDTEQLLKDIVNEGISFLIVGTRPEYTEKILNFHVTKQTLEQFLNIVNELNIDPIGESGEYHTIVTSAPLLKKRIVIRKTEIVKTKRYDISIIREYELL